MGGGCERSSSPPQSHLPSKDSQLTASVWGGDYRVRGMGYHGPTPQAGKVTDSDGGGRVRVGGGGGVRGQALPSLMGSLYRNTEEIRAMYNRIQ